MLRLLDLRMNQLSPQWAADINAAMAVGKERLVRM